jgi:hypothetical protein
MSSDPKRARENTQGNVLYNFNQEGNEDDTHSGDDGGSGVSGVASEQTAISTNSVQPITKTRREQVRRACVKCAGSKRKCSGVFPCERCIRLGCGDTCVEVQLKRKGMSSDSSRITISDNISTRLDPLIDSSSSRKRRLDGGGSQIEHTLPLMAMNTSLVNNAMVYGLQPGVLFDHSTLGSIGPSLSANLSSVYGASPYGSVSMPVSLSNGYPPSILSQTTRMPQPQTVSFAAPQLPPPPRDLEISVDSTQWNMQKIDASIHSTTLRDTRLSSPGGLDVSLAALGAHLHLSQPSSKDPFKRELSSEDVLDLQHLNLATSSRFSGSRQASRDSPQKDLWSPGVDEGKHKNGGLIRAEVSGYSGRLSEELDGLKLPDLRREFSSNSLSLPVSPPSADVTVKSSIVLMRSTGSVMVLVREEPLMYVSSNPKPFSIVKSPSWKIDATDLPDKVSPFPCVRFGFPNLNVPLVGSSDGSGIQAIHCPIDFAANIEARKLLNLGEDIDLSKIVILAGLSIEAPLWVLPGSAALRSEIIRHTVFHKGSYCEVIGRYSRTFFKESLKILDNTSTSSSLVRNEEENNRPFTCCERIILEYYPSGCLKALLSIFTAVVDDVILV